MRSHGWLSASLFRAIPLGATQSGLTRLAIATTISIAALSLTLGSAAEAAPPALGVRLDAHVWETDTSSWVALADEQEVLPGDRILYKVRVENSGDEAASGPAAIGPVPIGTVMAPDTATSSDDVTVEYSIDGGRTFSSNPTLRVVDPDGKTRTIPAPIDRYTTLRWTWNTPLEPGTERAVSYQVRVR